MAEDTTIRDELARDRTALANERTLLAYGRTALGLLVLAAFIFRFVPGMMGIAFGVSAIIGAAAIGYIGWRNYRTISNRLAGSPVRDQLGLDE